MLMLGTQTRRIISNDPYSRLDIVQIKDGGLEGDVDDMRAFAYGIEPLLLPESQYSWNPDGIKGRSHGVRPKILQCRTTKLDKFCSSSHSNF